MALDKMWGKVTERLDRIEALLVRLQSLADRLDLFLEDNSAGSPPAADADRMRQEAEQKALSARLESMQGSPLRQAQGPQGGSVGAQGAGVGNPSAMQQKPASDPQGQSEGRQTDRQTQTGKAGK